MASLKTCWSTQPTSAEALSVVVDWVQVLIERGVGLVVFNAAYDLTMLRAEAGRHGLRQPDWDRLLVVDPLVVDWAIERGGLGPRRLVDVASYYGVPIEDAHDATVRCAGCARRRRRVGRAAPAGRHALGRRPDGRAAPLVRRAGGRLERLRRTGRAPDSDPHGWPLAG